MSKLLICSILLNLTLLISIIWLRYQVNNIIDVTINQLEELKETILTGKKEYYDKLSHAIAEKLVKLINEKGC